MRIIQETHQLETSTPYLKQIKVAELNSNIKYHFNCLIFKIFNFKMYKPIF